VTGAVWTFDASDGELIVRTGVSGRAARMGHRLTIAMKRWQATVSWDGAQPPKPTAVEVVIDVDSFEVLRGEGGVKGLTGPEKALVKSNALKSLGANRYPQIRFTADTRNELVKTDDGYRLTGTLQIRGRSRKQVIELRTEDLGDAWRMSTESAVRQSDYGVKPYSMFLGSMKVADGVAVSFTAVHLK
jgi:polyisoprenoid-binding protein YceI